MENDEHESTVRGNLPQRAIVRSSTNTAKKWPVDQRTEQSASYRREPANDTYCEGGRSGVVPASDTSEAPGRLKQKVVPVPGTLSTLTEPPWLSTIPFTIDRPSPAPLREARSSPKRPYAVCGVCVGLHGANASDAVRVASAQTRQSVCVGTVFMGLAAHTPPTRGSAVLRCPAAV